MVPHVICSRNKQKIEKGKKKGTWRTFLDVAAVCKTQEEAAGEEGRIEGIL